MKFGKILIRRFACLAGIFVLLCNLCVAQNKIPDQTIVSKADDYLKPLVKEGRFSGSVLLARGDKVILSKGYGMANLEYGIPNTPQTRFRIASLTKEFTATAIMMLQESGKLDAQDSICKYVPECPAAWEPVKLYHLMNHTSGIPEFYKVFPDIDAYRRTPTTIARTLERARTVSPASTPGEKVSYSSLGFMLLGYVIEKTSGKAYEDFLKENIFEPLKMKHTGLEQQKRITMQRAAGYARDKDGTLINAPYYDLSYISAAGGLYSTIEDLYLFDQALYTEKILKQKTLAAMFTPGLENFGYAWDSLQQFDRRLIRADGRSFGFSTSMMRYPSDQVTVIVLSNIETAGADKIADALGAIIFGQKYEPPAQKK